MKSGETVNHRGSTLLKEEENQEVFQLIGNRCQKNDLNDPSLVIQCLTAGVIQLYVTTPPAHKEWIKRNTGIITLIRDNPKRSYFFRLYCLQRRAMLWEHEVYNSLEYHAPLPYFHTFEAEDCMVAFNFANETDAITLRNILLSKLRRQERRSTKEVEPLHGVTLPRKNQSSSSHAFPTGSTSNLLNGSFTTIGVNRSASSSSMNKNKKKKKNKDSKKKLTKGDIGLPSDFRHLAHMGLDTNKKSLEFDRLDPNFSQLLRNAGVSENQFNDRETRQFIYDFIERSTREGEDLKSANHKSSGQPPALPQRQENPPPVPARTVLHQARAPPPPPGSSNPSSTHSNASLSTSFAQRPLPSRPPPPNLTAAPPLPPPPPPPISRAKSINNASNNTSGSVPPPPPPPLNLIDADGDKAIRNITNNNNNNESPDPRGMLMDSIRSGTTLKRVEPMEVKPSVGHDYRTNLLEQIRQGIELKPVASEVKSNSPEQFQFGLAAALSRALNERSRAIHSDSGESSEDSSSEEDDWD